MGGWRLVPAIVIMCSAFGLASGAVHLLWEVRWGEIPAEMRPLGWMVMSLVRVSDALLHTCTAV